MAIITRKFSLKWSKKITPRVMHLAFAPVEGVINPFIAGQFITFHITHDGKKYHRSYSIANSPTQLDALEISAAYVAKGLASELFFNMQPETEVEISGPHGLFTLKEEQPKRYILVATGTGVTPYRSMLPSLQKKLEQEDLKVELILGVRDRTELLFEKEFTEFANNNPNFNFTACYSRHQPESPKPFEMAGRTLVALAALHLNPNEDIVYLCGNPSMIDDAFALLVAKGFDRKHVRREKYSFSH